MARIRRTTKAYLELARVSNLPSVVSNVLAGCAVGAAAEARPFPWGVAVGVSLAAALLYTSGMVLNDVLDVETDELTQPQRPIPSGRVIRSAAEAFGVGAMALGVGVLAWHGTTTLLLGLLLCGLIVLYDYVHQRHAWSVLLVAGCRGMIYLVAATAVTWQISWTLALGLAGIVVAYNLGVAILANTQTEHPGHERLVTVLLCAISLVDALILVALGRWAAAGAAVICFLLALLAHRHGLGLSSAATAETPERV